MRDKFSSDGVLVIIAAFLIGLTVITWMEAISQVLDMPKLVEWSWIFVLIFSFIGATGLLYIFQKRSRGFKLMVIFFLLLLLIGSVFFFQAFVLS